MEQVTTENVSTRGVCLVCRQNIKPGERHAISSMSLGRRLGARVVHCQARSDKTFSVGMELDQPLANWWDFGLVLEPAAEPHPR